MTVHRFAAAAFLYVAFSTGCSGGGSSPGPSSTPTPATTVKPTATPSPTPTLGPDVTVNVTGSTDTKPYQIVLQTNATAVVTKDYGQSDATMTSTTVAAADAAQFFTDLAADTPISNINPGLCTKSASFGTTTTLTYDGYTSGDVSCAQQNGPATGQKLYSDEQQIESDLRSNIGPLNN